MNIALPLDGGCARLHDRGAFLGLYKTPGRGVARSRARDLIPVRVAELLELPVTPVDGADADDERRSDVEDVLVELLGHLQRGAHRVRGCGAGMGPRGWRARDRRTRPPQFQKYGSTVFCSIGEMWRSTMPSMCLCLLHHFSMCGPTSYRIGPFDTCVERIMSGRVRRSAILGDCERGSARAESERPVS